MLAVLTASSAPAGAADARTEAAREHSRQADAYYKLEKYPNAIGEYEQAYLSKPDASFLFNIAQCHRLMGHAAEAIKFYRRFLNDAAPSAPSRAIAEKHIRDLEEASKSTTTEPPAAAAAGDPVAAGRAASTAAARHGRWRHDPGGAGGDKSHIRPGRHDASRRNQQPPHLR